MKTKNFLIEEIDKASDINELNEKEIYWIKYYNSTDRLLGYNLAYGGDNKIMLESTKRRIAVANKGRSNGPMSEEQKKKIGDFFRGRKVGVRKKARKQTRKPNSPEAMEKLRQANIGKKHTEETKRKIREKHTTSEAIARARDANIGKKHSEEVKKKMSESHKGKKRTKEHQENLNKARRGLKHSQESKDKMRASRLIYLEKKKWEETEKEKELAINSENLIVKLVT